MGRLGRRFRTREATAWVKPGLSDDDENVGARFDDVAHGLPNAAQERAQARSHGQVAHHRHVIEGKQGDEALRRHGLATDPPNATGPSERSDSARISLAPS